MNCAIMGNLDGDSTRVAFDLSEIRRIIHLDAADTVFSQNNQEVLLRIGDSVYKIENVQDKAEVGPYLIVLDSSKAFSVKEYQMLFDIKELSDDLLSGKDVTGRQHLCKRYNNNGGTSILFKAPSELEILNKKLEEGGIAQKELDDLKQLVRKLREGDFFAALTMEVSGKIKEIAQELIAFRKDLQSRIEPGIIDLARKDIPEASNQLEGINETLEKSTMKIMDINEEQMEIANRQLTRLKGLLEQIREKSGTLGEHPQDSARTSNALMEEIVLQQIKAFEKISSLSLKMLEPLSFQDLVGQRIQRIVRLVKTIEERIEDLIISFGVKLQKHREEPTLSYEEVSEKAEEMRSELRGPAREGEGLDQQAIDELLASL